MGYGNKKWLVPFHVNFISIRAHGQLNTLKTAETTPQSIYVALKAINIRKTLDFDNFNGGISYLRKDLDLSQTKKTSKTLGKRGETGIQITKKYLLGVCVVAQDTFIATNFIASN